MTTDYLAELVIDSVRDILHSCMEPPVWLNSHEDIGICAAMEAVCLRVKEDKTGDLAERFRKCVENYLFFFPKREADFDLAMQEMYPRKDLSTVMIDEFFPDSKFRELNESCCKEWIEEVFVEDVCEDVIEDDLYGCYERFIGNFDKIIE